MRLSRLRRLLPSQVGFFPDVSEYGVDAVKHTIYDCHGFHQKLPSYSPPSLLLKVRDQLSWRFTNEIPKYPPKPIINKLELDNAHHHSILFPPDLWMKIHNSNSKYIMVCCFFVPILHYSGVGSETNSLINVASELRDLYGSDFEIVLVAKMRRGWLNHKPTFNHFFSGFPPFCRVIPFSDVKARDHICQLLGLEDSDPMFLLLERSSECTATYRVLTHDYIGWFRYNGADKIPYSKQTSNATYNNNPSQLDVILGRKSSDIQVSRISGESVSLSQLEGKVVGLYLCFTGTLMLKLDQVSRDCRERGLEFEAVLVYMPFNFLCSANTLAEAINDVLYKLCDPKSWWIMPYIDSISRKLWFWSPSCTHHGEDEDRLIIVGPNGKYVDPYAGAFLDKYGVDVYPFTCERLIDWKLEKVRSVTLGSRDFVLGKDINGGLEKVPVKQLHGRVILVCFDCGWTKDTGSGTHGLLAEYYHQIKSAHPSFEAVFVSLNNKSAIEKLHNVVASELPPWLVCPPQSDHCNYVYDMLRIDIPTSIAFGEDGRVCSFGADSLLMEMGVDAYPFNGGDLRQEVIDSLAVDNGSWTIPELGYFGA